jgi:retron-type reverse transcriptase
MGLTTPETVGKRQTTLHDKAKNSPDYRFYTLYDKMYRSDVLTFAYRLCRANGGAPGVDGQTFDDIKDYGVRRWLDELATELREKIDRPEAVRRVMIPKPGQKGRYRPLGIPTIKDRGSKRLRCWSWSRSSRPTCNQNNMPTAPNAVL